jgi:copper resistance protein B
MTRIVTALSVLLGVLATFSVPAQAQHAGHTMPAPATADPHAGHSMPGMAMPEGHGAASPTPSTDPHAAHRRSPPRGEKRTPRPAMSHGGHAMPAPSTRPNSHAGHTPGMTMPPDPHAGHTMPSAKGASGDHSMHAMPSAPTASDPRSGHLMHSMDASAPSIPQGPPPMEAFTGPRHAADRFFNPASMVGARELLRKEQGDFRTYSVLVDRLESRFHNGRDGYLWDAQGWYGGDINRLWIKTEGEGSFGGKFEEAEFQALWGRAISPWWDLQAGARHDIRPGSDRSYGVLGIQGLAPYYFEIDAAAFLSTKGDVTARLEAEYDQLITQKLILQPRLEMNLAAQDIREFDIGAGVSSIDTGLRLRYEFVPEFAPYIGVEYSRKLGKTARFARDDGENVGVTSLLVGLRMWF